MNKEVERTKEKDKEGKPTTPKKLEIAIELVQIGIPQ